jgi:hypothetical protein
MDLVKPHRLRENRDDKSYRGDEAMPYPLPESRHFALLIRCFLELIRAGYTAREDKNQDKANTDEAVNFHSLSPHNDVIMKIEHEEIL